MISQIALQKYLDELRQKHSYSPLLRVIVKRRGDRKYSKAVAGRAVLLSGKEIHIMNWMLADTNLALKTIRHEFAHFLAWLEFKDDGHGKGFHKAMQEVSPQTWQDELRWIPSPAITAYQKQLGIFPNKSKLKIMFCTSCKEEWRVKKVKLETQYSCPYCKTYTIAQKGV